MNIIHFINSISQQLQTIHDQQLAQQYAWWLLEKLTQKSKADLITQKTINLDQTQKQQLQTWLDKMINEHKPIAYILGDVPFGDLTIQVEPPVLIPRPETEEWVIDLINGIKKSEAQNLHILDMCTGSGCIALLLAHALPNAHIYAVDIADEAITLTQKNQKLLNIANITIVQSNLFEQLPDNIKFDLIVTNPPYITDEEFEQLDASVKDWEDKRALHADDNGTAIIKQMVKLTPHYIKQNEALKRYNLNQLYIEIGWQQSAAVGKLMQNNSYNAITTLKDSAQKDRVVSGRVDNVAITADKK